MITEDNSFFSFSIFMNIYYRFPKKDCVCLPIVHSSAEELARYIVFSIVFCIIQTGELIKNITGSVLNVVANYQHYMQKRGIYEITVGVSEIENQEARYFHSISFMIRYTTSIEIP